MIELFWINLSINSMLAQMIQALFVIFFEQSREQIWGAPFCCISS